MELPMSHWYLLRVGVSMCHIFNGKLHVDTYISYKYVIIKYCTTPQKTDGSDVTGASEHEVVAEETG